MRCSSEPFLARNRVTLTDEINEAHSRVLRILSITALTPSHPLAALLPIHPLHLTTGTLDPNFLHNPSRRNNKHSIANFIELELFSQLKDSACLPG